MSDACSIGSSDPFWFLDSAFASTRSLQNSIQSKQLNPPLPSPIRTPLVLVTLGRFNTTVSDPVRTVCILFPKRTDTIGAGILGLHIDVVPSPRYSRTPHWRGSVSRYSRTSHWRGSVSRYSRTPHWRGSVSQVFSDSTLTWFRLPVFSDSTLTWFRLPGILGLHTDVVRLIRSPSRTPVLRSPTYSVSLSDSLILKSELIRSPFRTPVLRFPTFWSLSDSLILKFELLGLPSVFSRLLVRLIAVIDSLKLVPG